jgi:LPXTG-motif cell wall-anchored protein
MPGFSLNASSVRSGGAYTWHRWEVAVRTAMRALLLAVVLVVVPASVAYAGIRPDPNYGPVTTKATTTTTTPPTGGTVPKANPAPGLAQTGSDSTPLVWAGVAALAVGGVLVIGARRRAAVRR